MSSRIEEPDVEIIQRGDSTRTRPLSRSFLHPYAGIAILVLDWLLFSGNVLTFGLTTPILALIGFLLGFVATFLIQLQQARDTLLAAITKGLLAGILVGIPTPIAGTLVGGLILALAGLDPKSNRR